MFANEIVVAGILNVGTNRFEKPERRVDGVVFGRFTGIRESIREHAPIDALSESLENVASDLGPARRKSQAGKRDHGIASPIGEPVIAGDYRMKFASLYDELVRRHR